MKNLLLSIVLCVLAVTAFAQDEQFSTKNKKAIKAFVEGRKDYQVQKYDEAIKLSNKALEEDSLFLEADVLLGFIYQETAKPEMALNYFKRAIAINPNYQPTLFFTMGLIDVQLYKYDEGAQYLQTFISSGRGGADMQKLAVSYLADCKFGAWAIKHPVPFEPVNLGAGVNTAMNEYFPTITADGQTLLFTRELRDSLFPEGNEDFYMSNKNSDGTWGRAYNLGSPLNTMLNEGAPTLSANGRLLIFAGCDRPDGFGSCDLYYSIRRGDNWTPAHNLGAPINSRHWESQPCLSADGRALYFVRGTVSGYGYKDQDIYVTELTDSNTWTFPHKLSDSINTPGNEECPYIAADNQTLYFCSDGWPGLGGTDIFVSRRKPDGSWGTPKNLGYPINSSGNETGIIVNPNGQLAYFSSDRKGGYGGLDIYQFALYDSVRPTPITYMKGKVYDAKTQRPLAANFNLIDLATKATIMQSTSMGDGTFMVCIPLHKNYALNVAKKGYLFYSENFALHDSNATSVHPYMVNIPLQPIDTGATVVLKNIFFATNKFDLRPESEVELDKLVSFLQVNPTVKIEVGGHTDNVGTPQSNITLSNNRAKSVYDYLVAHGIAADRLRYKGYGQTKPIAPNDSENGRALNRRTEMKIIGK